MVPVDASYDTMRELGRFGKFHVVDLNETAPAPTDFFLLHKKRVVAASYWEKKLKRFEELMVEFKVQLPPFDAAENDPSVESKSGDVVSEVRNYIEPLELELSRNIEYRNAETRKLNELFERHVVLEAAKAHLFQAEVPLGSIMPPDHTELKQPLMMDHQDPITGSSSRSSHLQHMEDGGSKFHNYICGVMPAMQQGHFDRMLFRISRGNAYARYGEIEQLINDPATNEPVKKVVFYVAFVGVQIGRRIEKMCDYFRATRYEVPEAPENVEAQLRAIERETGEKQEVVTRTNEQIVQLLNRVARDPTLPHLHGGACNSPLRMYQESLRREKIISDTLKKVVVTNGSRMMRVEGWCPVEDLDSMHVALAEASRQTGSQPPIVQYPQVRGRPPTYFKLNKFTSTFQGIVNTYGIPRYQEVNPGLFTIVTFPFLFGVMYGDIGHGTLLFFFSLYLLINEKKFEAQVKNRTMPELLGMAFGGRYLLFMMSLFAIYAGFVYNDCMSVPIDFFGSAWEFNQTAVVNATDGVNFTTLAGPPTKSYPFGLDPGWFHTKNELTFFNSLKMKLSVTIGVVHMSFGIILGLFNHLYFRNYVSIYCEFIPQLLFLLSVFGYMIFLIIIKMCIDWDNSPGRVPPSLIQTMIKMFLSPGSVPAEEQLYANQGLVQVALVLLAVACIPWMLFPKPYVERYLHEKKKAVQNLYIQASSDDHDEKHHAAAAAHDSHSGGGGHDDGEEYVFSEHMIHQSIHTIEFVLGAVSNTASYLRLWALSLAHAELASVFWDKMIMSYGVETGKFYMTFVAMAVWVVATAGVLCAMDVLECFLHALRLHWVEFQNKFFQADGYSFEPFNFEIKDDD